MKKLNIVLVEFLVQQIKIKKLFSPDLKYKIKNQKNN